jgi:hypothetical protein
MGEVLSLDSVGYPQVACKARIDRWRLEGTTLTLASDDGGGSASL